jgi:ABC-2 type transport system ATP-binding protein
VLVSSHQLNEVQEVADRVVILNHGRLVRSGSIAELTAGSDSVVVRSPAVDTLRAALGTVKAGVEQIDAGTLRIRGLPMDQVGHIAFGAGVELHELSTQRFDLEQLFFALTSGQPDPQGAPAWSG